MWGSGSTYFVKGLWEVFPLKITKRSIVRSLGICLNAYWVFPTKWMGIPKFESCAAGVCALGG